MKRPLPFILCLCLCMCMCLLPLAASPAVAAARREVVKPLGSFGAWKAFAFRQSGHPVCYMTLTTERPARGMKRGPLYLMITDRPGEGSKDVVSYAAGYAFKGGSDVTVKVDGKDFDMFTQNETAWSRDAATDHALAAAIARGAVIEFAGTPAKGPHSMTDKLSLHGSLDAYRAISKACGIRIEEPRKPVHKTHKKSSKKRK